MTIGEKIVELLAVMKIKFKIDDKFIKATAFGESFQDGDIDGFKGKLMTVVGSESADSADRVYADQLLKLINQHYGKKGTGSYAKGFEAIKVMFMAAPEVGKDDPRHLWLYSGEPKAQLPMLTDSNVRYDRTLQEQVISLRAQVGADTYDCGERQSQDGYKLLAVSAKLCFESSLSNPALPARLEKLKTAITSARDLDRSAAEKVLQAIDAIELKLSMRREVRSEQMILPGF